MAPRRKLAGAPLCVLDFDALPGGQARVKILVSAGFRTSRVQVKVGLIPRKRYVAEIITPAPNYVARRGQTVKLLGHAHSSDGKASVESLQWKSNQDGALGTGRELLVHTCHRAGT